jgi:hypothetical protein
MAPLEAKSMTVGELADLVPDAIAVIEVEEVSSMAGTSQTHRLRPAAYTFTHTRDSERITIWAAYATLSVTVPPDTAVKVVFAAPAPAPVQAVAPGPATASTPTPARYPVPAAAPQHPPAQQGYVRGTPPWEAPQPAAAPQQPPYYPQPQPYPGGRQSA